MVKIWAVALGGDGTPTMSCVATLEDAQSRTIRCCEWSPNGQYIASASFDGTVVVWESHNQTRRNWDQVAQIEGHESEVKSVAWSADGNFLCSCGRDKKLWIWEKLRDCDFECVTVLDKHTQDVKFVTFHPSEMLILSASYDDTVKVWQEDNDDWFCATTLKAHTSTVWGVCFNSEGSKFVSCGDDQSLILWESDGGDGGRTSKNNFRVAGRIADCHNGPIYSVHWNAHNNFIATGAGDNGVVVCTAGDEEGAVLAKQCFVDNAHCDADVNCVRWNPAAGTSHLLATCGDDGSVRLWALEL